MTGSRMPPGGQDLVAGYLSDWRALPDGEPFSTPTSVLAPARRDGDPLMLKIATTDEEARGNAVMSWWAGRGAAAVLEHDERAVLLERATGARSLRALAQASDQHDDDATRVLCHVAMRLHAIDDPPPRGLTELGAWFEELFRHADEVGGFHARAARLAQRLLAGQREIVVLHGDLHHGNVLDFGAARRPADAGWLAIDPKSLTGDRAFDFTNILCNPTGAVATRPGRLSRQVGVICATTGIRRLRLLAWTVAWCGLSSAWMQRDPGAREHEASSADLPTDASTRAVGREAERLLHQESAQAGTGTSLLM